MTPRDSGGSKVAEYAATRDHLQRCLACAIAERAWRRFILTHDDPSDALRNRLREAFRHR